MGLHRAKVDFCSMNIELEQLKVELLDYAVLVREEK